MSTVVNKNQNAAYGFIPPDIAADADKKIEVVFPTQGIAALGSLADDAELAVVRAATVVTATITDDVTLIGALSSDLKPGDMLLLVVTATGDDFTLTLDTALGNKALEITDGDTLNVLCIFNGTNFEVFGQKGDKGDPGDDGADAVIEDNSLVPAKLQKGTDDLKTYTLKSVLGVVQWVEDVAE